MHKDNQAVWSREQNGFYEVWYLKLNLLKEESALWIRYTTLSLKNGFKSVVETWAIWFDGKNNQKIALKDTFPFSSFKTTEDHRIQIQHNGFGRNFAQGSIRSKKHSIAWDLSFNENPETFFHVPPVLQKLKLTKSIVCKPNVDLHFNGTVSVDETTYECDAAPGCQGHIWGTDYAHEWAWAHCNSFDAADCVLEALSARVKMGKIITSPILSAIYFRYQDEEFKINALIPALRIKSAYSIDSWDFQYESPKFSIQGNVECDQRDLVGVQYEDTRGGHLYCHNTALANCKLDLKIRGQEKIIIAKRSVAFETVGRKRAQSVEFLV